MAHIWLEEKKQIASTECIEKAVSPIHEKELTIGKIHCTQSNISATGTSNDLFDTLYLQKIRDMQREEHWEDIKGQTLQYK